jgi:hypothetical protein
VTEPVNPVEHPTVAVIISSPVVLIGRLRDRTRPVRKIGGQRARGQGQCLTMPSAGESCHTKAYGCKFMGGDWQPTAHDDRPHGLAIVEAFTGPDGWGTTTTSVGGRIVWARLTW